MRDSKYFDDCIIVVYVGVNGGSVGGHALLSGTQRHLSCGCKM